MNDDVMKVHTFFITNHIILKFILNGFGEVRNTCKRGALKASGGRDQVMKCDRCEKIQYKICSTTFFILLLKIMAAVSSLISFSLQL